MEVTSKFLYLPEELHSRILSFLPYRDILRCTSVCKALHQVYISSSELQYIVELGGQRLLPLPCTNDNTVSISKCLQLLKDKAHAWFKFDIHSFETVSIPAQFYGATTSLANGHLCLWNQENDSAKIFPVLPKPSQQLIERDWPPGSLCSLPNAYCADVFMDPAQNLIAIAYCAIPDEYIDIPEHDVRFFIELGALDGDRVHPKAAGRTLYLSELPGCEGKRFLTESESLKLEGMGRHIALRRALTGDDTAVLVPEEICSLHIWDWQESTTSNCVLVDTTVAQDPEDSMDFCFLGNDRLLTVGQRMKLYSFEDMSRPPQLLACFLLPVWVEGAQCLLPMDDISPISQWQAQPEVWASDPENRLLSLTMPPQNLVFIISTRIFFDLSLLERVSAIKWSDWGPSNTRVFRHDWRCRIGVSGNRVLRSFPVIDGTTEDSTRNSAYRLHMMDFSPLAVERRQGLGQVVTEPSSIKIIQEDSEEALTLTTFLPYVDVMSDRTFGPAELVEIWVDKDRIYLPKDTAYTDVFNPSINDLEVIDI